MPEPVNQWERIVPGGDCRCGRGAEYSFYTRTADPKKVVFFLDGGGACWSAATCAPSAGKYRTTVDPPNAEGVLDFANPLNPFAGYSFVYVPYCTGDLHIGDATTTYAPGLTVHHKGYVNGKAALDRLVSAFPGATDVVVIGVSAGAVTAPVYAGLLADLLPGARISSIADSAGGLPDAPQLDNLLTGSAWQVGTALPAWAGKATRTSLPGLTVISGKHAPRITFARIDHAYDEVQTSYIELAGVPAGDLLALIRANGKLAEAAGVRLRSYTAPGKTHLFLDGDGFYTETVNGVALADWITRPATDVYCTRCA